MPDHVATASGQWEPKIATMRPKPAGWLEDGLLCVALAAWWCCRSWRLSCEPRSDWHLRIKCPRTAHDAGHRDAGGALPARTGC
jgi:hypothetical protein